MKSSEIITLMATIIQGISGILALVFAFLAWRTTKHIARSQYARSLEDIWNTVCCIALSNPGALKAAAKFEGLDAAPSEKQNEAFVAFLYLNALQASFLGMKDAMMDKKCGEKVLIDILYPMLEDNDIFILTQGSGYDPRFSAYCRTYRAKLLLDPVFVSRKYTPDERLLQNLLYR